MLVRMFIEATGAFEFLVKPFPDFFESFAVVLENVGGADQMPQGLKDAGLAFVPFVGELGDETDVHRVGDLVGTAKGNEMREEKIPEGGNDSRIHLYTTVRMIEIVWPDFVETCSCTGG